MDHVILAFLALAVLIIFLAIILTRLFRKSMERDKKKSDLNRDRDDATDHGTWIGIRKSMDDDY